MTEEKRQSRWRAQDSATRHRLNRRQLLRRTSLVGAGAAGVALLACRREPQSGAPISEDGGRTAVQPKRGGTIVDTRFQVLIGRTMDPHRESPTSNRSRRLWYQSLLGYDIVTRELQPEVAEKWEQPSETEYIFTLAAGVKWHNKPPANGRALTTDDVMQSLRRVATPEPAFVSSSLLAPLDKMEAIDQQRIRMTTRSPNAVFLQVLRSDGTLLVAPDVAEGAGRFTTPEAVVGTGPFILKSFEDIGAESVRNPEYYKQGLPYLDGHTFRHFGDENQAYSAFLAKQVDIHEVSGPQGKDYRSRLGGRTPQLAKEDSVSNWLMPNARVQPFSDARLIRALRLLADYQDMRDSHGKVWRADAEYGLIFPAAMDQWDLPQEEFTRRIFWQQPKDAAYKEGLDLLSAAGFNRDNKLEFQMSVQANAGDPVPVPLAELLQAHWRRVSQGIVEPQLRVLEGAQANQARAQRTFVYALFPVAGAFNDPDASLTAIFQSDGSRNYTGFSDRQIDQMIDRQRTIFNNAQRLALVQDIIRLLIDRTAQAIPYKYYSLNAVSERVRGYTPDGGTGHTGQFGHVWIDA